MLRPRGAIGSGRSDGRPPGGYTGADRGFSIIEAVVALSLIAVVATAWAHTRVGAARGHQHVAERQLVTEVANSELQQIQMQQWDRTGIASGPDVAAQVDGEAMVIVAGGVDAFSEVTHRGRTVEVERYVTDTGSPQWRRVVVVVRSNGENGSGAEIEVRRESAVMSPDWVRS